MHFVFPKIIFIVINNLDFMIFSLLVNYSLSFVSSLSLSMFYIYFSDGQLKKLPYSGRDSPNIFKFGRILHM